MAVFLAITLAPVVILIDIEPSPSSDLALGDAGQIAGIVNGVNDLIANIVGDPAAC